MCNCGLVVVDDDDEDEDGLDPVCQDSAKSEAAELSTAAATDGLGAVSSLSTADALGAVRCCNNKFKVGVAVLDQFSKLLHKEKEEVKKMFYVKKERRTKKQTEKQAAKSWREDILEKSYSEKQMNEGRKEGEWK
ncbi:hypothetical protein T08_12869 [Trichinella sp. T8]|nr:hypothetical protein T08_12869 [Trichinella sp. T8]